MAFGDVDEDEDDAGKQALDGAPVELAAETQIAQTWLECEDEQGNLYYYNQQTGESAWTLPEGDVVPTVVPISILPAETRADLEIDAPADTGPGSPSERQLLNQDQEWEQTRSDGNTKDTRSVTFVLDSAGLQENGQEVSSSTLENDDNAATSAPLAKDKVDADETSSNQLHAEEQKVQEDDATDEVRVEGKEPGDIESQEGSQQEQFARYRKESLARLESLRGERNDLADERDGLAHKLVATQAALQRAQLTVSNLEKELQAATKRDESIISGLRKEFESLTASNEQYAEYARVSAASLKVAQGDLEALRSNHERLQANHDQAVHEANELRAAASERAAAEAELEARTSDQLSQANDEASRLKQDLARLVEELGQAKRELADTKSELKRAQGDLARTSETQAQTERRSEILLDVAKEEANQEIATQVASAREESAAQCKRAMAQAIGMLESQVQIAQDAHTKNALSKIVGLLAKHHASNTREQQAGAMTAQQAQLDALATTIHDLQTRLAGTQTLEKELEQASRRSQQLERQVAALTARVEAADADTAEAKREVEQRSKYLEQELRAAIDEIEAGKVRESKLEAQEIKLRVRVQDLEAGNIEVPQYDPMLTKELSEARSSLATAQEDLHIARQDLERQHARLESLQASEAELKLALENAREEAMESAKRAEVAEAATQAAQEEAQALQGAAEEALAEVRHANAEASEVHGLLDVERRRHFQERTALLSELDLHKCAASARRKKAAKLIEPGEWHRLRLRARLDCDAMKTLGAQVQQDLQNFAEVLRSAKRDLGERTRIAAAARAAAAGPEINNERCTPRDERDLDVYSIESLAVSPSPNQTARPESLSKRKTMAFCRIHPQICHIINSSVIMANREMLELCNAHGQTRRWTLQGVADSYVKNRQTFDTLRLSAFCFATDPRSVYCAILHGQRQAAPKLSLLGDLSDPGLLAQSLYGLVQQIGFANHDLALEVCRVDDRSSRLIFRTDGIGCRSLRAAQALVDSLPVDPERTLVDERPASAPLVRRAKIKKVGLRRKLRKPKKTRRTKRGRGVAEDEEDGIAGNILGDREEGMMYVHHHDGESEGEEYPGDENDDEEDDGGCNRARNSQGRATSPAYHEVYTILVNDHPRIQFVALTRAVGPRPRHMGPMWANDGAEAVTSRLPGTGSIMDEIAIATRAWQLGQNVSGRHPLLNQLNYLHAPAATVHLVTHVTQALKDADYSLLHLESAQAVLNRSS